MPTDYIVSGLRAIGSWFSSWVVPLAAIGTLTMAILQTAKNLFPLRREFQRKRIREFLADSIHELSPDVVRRVSELERNLNRLTSKEACSCSTDEQMEMSEANTPCRDHIEPRRAELDLISLIAAGDEDAFYDLSIDQLAAEVKSVGSVILDYSRLHSTLLVCLATKATASDLLLTLDPPSHDPFWHESDEQKFEDKLFIKRYAAAKSRIATQLRCSIESMETSIAFRWKFALQLASFVLSFILGGCAVYLGPTHNDLVGKFFASLAIGVVAGFIAPVARDLVAGIEKLNT